MRDTTRKTSLVVILALGSVQSATPAKAADRPNLTGVWTTNSQTSHYPHNGVFATAVTIVQTEDELRESLMRPPSGRQEPNVDVIYSLTGSAKTMKVGGDELQSTAKWKGQALILQWKVRHEGSQAVLKRELSLSPDRQKLTMKVYLEGKNEPDQILFLDKQPNRSSTAAPHPR